MNVSIYKWCLRLLLREVTMVANMAAAATRNRARDGGE
ncbi:hypothetical protein ACP4OV_025484 [Aristida adscensionis]